MAGATLDNALRGLHGRRLLVGLSGGLDSTVLLHALATGRDGPASLRAIHVHHGLHPDADDWTAHCQRLCQSLDVACVVERVRVDAGGGLGPEGEARDARHAAFARALAAGESLVLAHHRDDQAETVLLRLLRGAGSDGLSGMRAQRGFAGGELLRPLLAVPRSDLFAYAQEHRLSWCEDPSNLDPGPDRNFLRLQVLPLLARRWPQASAALAHSARLLEEDSLLLGEESGRRLDGMLDPSRTSVLPVSGLLALSPAWRARVLRQWIERLQLPPLPGNAFAVIEAQLLSAPADRLASYRWSGAQLRRWKDGLHADRVQDEPPRDWHRAWDGAGSMALPDGGTLEFVADGEPGSHPEPALLAADFGQCRIGLRQGGERIHLPGRVHSHSLKQQLQEHEVEPWRRDAMPMLLSGDGELLAAGDQLLSARLEAWCKARGLRLRWSPPAGN